MTVEEPRRSIRMTAPRTLRNGPSEVEEPHKPVNLTGRFMNPISWRPGDTLSLIEMVVNAEQLRAAGQYEAALIQAFLHGTGQRVALGHVRALFAAADRAQLRSAGDRYRTPGRVKTSCSFAVSSGSGPDRVMVTSGGDNSGLAEATDAAYIGRGLE
jgi:hypothetical protein